MDSFCCHNHRRRGWLDSGLISSLCITYFLSLDISPGIPFFFDPFLCSLHFSVHFFILLIDFFHFPFNKAAGSFFPSIKTSCNLFEVVYLLTLPSYEHKERPFLPSVGIWKQCMLNIFRTNWAVRIPSHTWANAVVAISFYSLMFLYGRQRGQQTSVESILWLFKGSIFIFFFPGHHAQTTRVFPWIGALGLCLQSWLSVSHKFTLCCDSTAAPLGRLNSILLIIASWLINYFRSIRQKVL